jgi:hypothetical protein
MTSPLIPSPEQELIESLREGAKAVVAVEDAVAQVTRHGTLFPVTEPISRAIVCL